MGFYSQTHDWTFTGSLVVYINKGLSQKEQKSKTDFKIVIYIRELSYFNYNM
jgi:hypothetical protein